MNKTRVILIIASSIDGRIALPNGGNAHLGSIEDKKLLNEALAEVDATIFGSGTLKAHKSTFLVKQFTKGNSYVLASNQPVSIVAGEIKNFSKQWLYFKQPIERWLISSDSISDNNNCNFDKEFLFKDSWRKTLEVIHKEGIKKIALLGGAKLIDSFAKENLIDEIKITIVPKIIGGKYSWISSMKIQNFSKLSNNWTIKSVKEIDTNEIFIHYTREKRD